MGDLCDEPRVDGNYNGDVSTLDVAIILGDD
jgi:hypothetical protein